MFRRTTPETEKLAGDEQTTFGSQGATVEDWLASTYDPESPRGRRFRFIASTFLSGPPKRVLEIGAGLGDFSVYCATQAPQHSYTVSDLTEGKFDKYFDTVKEFFHSDNPFELASFEAEKIPFGNNSFDIVFIRSAVHHFDHPYRAFAEIFRILSPTGKVVFFHDPIGYDFPIVRTIQKLMYATDARFLGYNEHIYTVREYLSFGWLFASGKENLDPIYLEEFAIHSKRWRGIKGYIGKMLPRHPYLFSLFLIRTYGMPYFFVFQKAP